MPFLMSDVSTATPRADDCRGAKAIGENAEHPDAKSNRIETFNSFIFVVMVFQGQVVRCNITPPQGKNVVFLHFPQEQVGTPKQPGTTQMSISFVRQVLPVMDIVLPHHTRIRPTRGGIWRKYFSHTFPEVQVRPKHTSSTRWSE